jgi:hypothetical protein
VQLGKAANDLVVANGYAQLPPSEDPGVRNHYLHLLADRQGQVTLSAVADGKSGTTDVRGEKTIHIIRSDWAYLPQIIHNEWRSRIPSPPKRPTAMP